MIAWHPAKDGGPIMFIGARQKRDRINPGVTAQVVDVLLRAARRR
jgi:hypothetical protein